jgi:exosortase
MENRKLANLIFTGMLLLLILAPHTTFLSWFRLAWGDQQYGYLWVIPLIAAVLIAFDRRRIFARTCIAPEGMALVATGIVLGAVAHVFSAGLGRVNGLTVAMLGTQIFCAGSFRFCYGRQAWREARFPLLFLLFMVPFPEPMLERVVWGLQHGSAAVVDALFSLAPVVYLREGLCFYLPGLSIEIAPECSGINSSMALLVCITLLANFGLRTRWRQLLLVASIVPVVLFKNGLRIATLSVLAVKVDPSFLTGSLHHRGGIVFFALMLLVMFAFFQLLRYQERDKPDRRGDGAVSS